MIEHSVVIPTFNHVKYLPLAIKSILDCEREVEVVIVNDGSTDDTKKYLDTLSGVKIINQENSGAHHALNVGIAKSRGKYISILNDDDLFETNHLSHAYDLLSNKISDFVIHRARIIGSGPKFEIMEKHVEVGDAFIDNNGLLGSLFKFNWSVSTSAFSFSRSLIDKGLSFAPLAMNHDLDFLLLAILQFGARCSYSKEITWNYRCHGDNYGDSIKMSQQQFELAYTLLRSLKLSGKDLTMSEKLSLIDHALPASTLHEVEEILLNPAIACNPMQFRDYLIEKSIA